jgi:hypothetical protein
MACMNCETYDSALSAVAQRADAERVRAERAEKRAEDADLRGKELTAENAQLKSQLEQMRRARDAALRRLEEREHYRHDVP